MGIEKHKPLYHHWRIRKALTILEVLVAILLSCLVGAVLYQMFYTQDRTYSIQSEISEMQQNLRVAMERISRDLTMAGFAQPSWTTINGESGLDYSVRVTAGKTLDLVGCFDGAQAVLSEAVLPGATSLRLPSGDGDHFNTKTKSDISMGGRENAKITAVTKNILTIDTDPNGSKQGLRFGYSAGTEVYLVKWKTYWVDSSDPTQPVLRVNEHLGSGSQQIALFITGMEIALSNRVAEVSITSRTRNPDKTTGLYTTGGLSNKIALRNVP
jgi:hypothetical protein